MRVILLDTATDYLICGIGQIEGESATVLACADEAAPQSSNTQLLPRLSALMKEHDIAMSSIGGIVCGIGPGSFTGVRIGVATAKGLAQGARLPLWGVPTLDAIAWRFVGGGFTGTLAVVDDAMRKEVFPALFEISDSTAKRLSDHRVTKPDEAAHEWQELAQTVADATGKPLMLTGNGLTKYKDVFTDALGSAATIAKESLWTPSSAGLLTAFAASAKDSDSFSETDPAALSPIYVRLPDAEEGQNIASKHKGGPAKDKEDMLPDLWFSTMTASDIEEVTVLEEQSFSTTRWNSAMFIDELDRDDRVWIVARDKGGKLVGFIGLWIINDSAHILDIAVARRKRRRGIAAELLRRASVPLRDMGARQFTLEVAEHNTTAIRFYTAHGFSSVGLRKGYYPDGQDALIMDGPLLPAEVSENE